MTYRLYQATLALALAFGIQAWMLNFFFFFTSFIQSNYDNGDIQMQEQLTELY